MSITSILIISDLQFYHGTFRAWSYLKEEVDGLTMELIFLQVNLMKISFLCQFTCILVKTRTVNGEGAALVIVPLLPSDPRGRAQTIAKILTTLQGQVRRRVKTSESPKYTRCPQCLPSTEEWYNGLLRAVIRALSSVKPLLPDLGDLELLSIAGELEHTEEQLHRVMGAVLIRSNVSKGFCSFCGVSWGAEIQASVMF